MQRPFDRILEQIVSLRSYWSPSWNVQAMAMVLLFGIAAILLLATQTSNSSPSLTDLFADRELTPSEAERIEAALGQAMLSDYVVERGVIRVPVEKRGQFLSAIREAKALPQSFHSPTQEAIQNASFIETSQHRSQRMHFALEEEARLAICALPGVVDASVHIDVTTVRAIRQQTLSSAVVNVKTNPDQPLDEQSFRTIQAMLLNFKAGLSSESITITDLTSRSFIRGSMDSQSPETMASLRRADLERAWQRKLASAISFATEACITVQVISSTDGLTAQSVSCSVTVPFAKPENEISATRTQHETAMRRRIQAALLPLIPNQNENLDEVIAVTVFDRPVKAVPSRLGRLSRSPNLLAVILVGVAGVMALLLLKNPAKPRVAQEELAPSLKIYEGQDSASHANWGTDASEQLQTIATQDPDAVAESLSDFIDRAS